MTTATDHPAETAATADDGREIVKARVFDYPPEGVYEAFRNPNHIMCWWGPKDFTNSFQEFDLRPGGHWRFVMHGPDGTDYKNESEFVEVAPAERIVFEHISPPNFRMTMTFENLGGKTRLQWRMLFETAAVCEAIKLRAPTGIEENFDRLGAHLAKMAERSTSAAGAAGAPFVLTRIFNAPRDVVWQAFTEREGLMIWFGPKGFTVSHATIDLRLGGIFHFGMRSGDGHEMWGKWTFREIVKPAKLAYIISMSDAEGGASPRPMGATWPPEILSTATFTEDGGKTTITLQWTAVNACEEEQKSFDARHDTFRMMCTEKFDQLEAYLAKASHA